ncbi:MAG TPA: hypothetical protein P5572_14480 [Phycisphaerae bacterium]|nr:hypothetical protein [Phycisphaerales bacterium]HRX86223.1 hypothetical protein [Phycisphaerae bacterium]
MKTKLVMLLTLTLVPAALAEDAAPKVPQVVALAPEDALTVLYAQKPAELVDHPFLSELQVRNKAEFSAFTKTTGETFNGPTMLAITGSPINPASIRVDFAIEPAGGTDAFFSALGETWMPLLGKLSGDPLAKVDTAGPLRTIRLPGPMPLTLFAAAKTGVVYASSRQADVTQWLAGEDLPARFVKGADAERIALAKLAGADFFGYLNARGLMTMAMPEMERSVPGLYAALGLDRFEFAALTAEWSRNFSVSATVGLTPGQGGVWDVIASDSSPVTIASLIPADYTTFVRGAWTSAADVVEQFNAALDAVDPDIAAEFRDECAEWRQDVGFDPLRDFAGNFVGEWIFAVRVASESDVSAVAAARLGDPAIFFSHMQAAIRRFGLEVQTASAGNTVIYSTPPTVPVQLAWAVVDGCLVVSDRSEPVVEIATAAPDAPTALAGAGLPGVLRRLPDDNAALMFVNLAQLARVALGEVDHDPQVAALAPTLQKLVDSDAGMGIAITREENALTVQLAANDGVGPDVRRVAWKSLEASVERSRELSKRVVSASNIRGIITACMIYANDHKETWPATMGELLTSGEVTPQMFRAPYDESVEMITAENVNNTSSYLYRDGTGLPPEMVVVCERELREGGANFGFADGHTEWVDGPRARELLEQMRKTAVR